MTWKPNWRTPFESIGCDAPFDRPGAKVRMGGSASLHAALPRCLPTVFTCPCPCPVKVSHSSTATATTKSMDFDFDTVRVPRLRVATATHPLPRIALVNKANHTKNRPDAPWSHGRPWYKYDWVDPAIKFVKWTSSQPWPAGVKYRASDPRGITDFPEGPTVHITRQS